MSSDISRRSFLSRALTAAAGFPLLLWSRTAGRGDDLAALKAAARGNTNRERENVSTPRPDYPSSRFITKVTPSRFRYHKGDGDMWPITWAADDNLYAGAGDNSHSPMNFWKITGDPKHGWGICLFLIDNMPIDIHEYCQIPPADPKAGVKPAGLLSLDRRLYFAVEAMNYGENPNFNRQRNIHGWIITTDDYGKTWNREATPTDFFTGRLSSCHFLQFGKDYEGARDDYVYAYFPGVGDDGNSYWENGDCILLGRVPKERILDRSAWEFIVELSGAEPRWDTDDSKAVPIFRYPLMCGEDHVSYNKGLDRYLLGNYAFIDEDGKPRPYHQGPFPDSCLRSQLTLFEAPEPWGPWSLFHVDDDWGTYGDYQPCFPTKWMSEDGKTVHMVSSGSEDDYNFTVQKLELEIAG
jgi:hypothetical protein